MAPGTLKARIKKETEKPSGLKVRAFVLRGEPAPAESRARFCDDAQGKLMETYARSIKICAWCKTKGYYAMKKGGRYLWVFAAISIVTLVPLIFEVEREVQTLELEELQVSERARARTHVARGEREMTAPLLRRSKR